MSVAVGRAPARRALIFILLLGLLLRVVYLGQVAALPFFHDPVGDSARYLERAREIVGGDWIPDRPFFYGGIFYPWILAGFRLLFADNLYPVAFAQALAGCGLAWALYRLAVASTAARKRTRGRVAGLVAAGTALSYGPFAFFEADILMISWALLALAVGALLLMRARRLAGRADPGAAGPAGGAARPRVLACAVAAGLLLALAATERPNLAALLPAAVLWTWAFFPRGRRLPASASVAVGGAFVLALVALMNHAVSGRWTPLTTSSGINFAIGNHAGARGTYEEPWPAGDSHQAAREIDLETASLERASALSGRPLGPLEASRFWWGRGWEWLTGNPGPATKLYMRKLTLFWNGQELPNHLDFAFLREAAPALWLMPIGFACLAPLGLYGLAAPAARRRLDPAASWLLAVMVFVPMATLLPFFIADRYRAVVAPPLIVAASYGMLDLVARLRGAHTRVRGMLLTGAALAATVLLSFPMVETDRSRDHWMLAQAYKKQGRLPEAIASYERAVAIEPASAVLRNNLGVALVQAGRPAEAEEQYRRAIELDAALAFPHKNLGLLLMRTGRRDEARAHLERALASEPRDEEIVAALADLQQGP